MRNIEVKARLLHPQSIRERLRRTTARFVATLQQRDVFFAVPEGRLKLRFVNDVAELIFYRRTDSPTLRGSDYERLAIADGESMMHLLDLALSKLGEVRKVRQLYVVNNVRIHVDAVEGLGDFLEIEAVLDADHDEEQCRHAAQELLTLLEIGPEAYESRAYIDLLSAAP